ncbi:MAG: DUF4276 family protein [Deltaproteobacteria bacterium]|nr:DUF4276 family protein [Deltaproteobacteria bacterium]
MPVLLRRLRDEAEDFNVDVLRPIRQTRTQLTQKTTLQRAIRLARLHPDCTAMLIIFDADNDCPMEYAAQIQEWAREASSLIPCAVVMAVKEYEAWFLATMESLRGKAGIKDNAVSHESSEIVRGAKEAIECQMMSGFSYMETTHQAAFTAQFDMRTAYLNCRSFRKLVKSFGELVLADNADIQWPPANWILGD